MADNKDSVINDSELSDVSGGFFLDNNSDKPTNSKRRQDRELIKIIRKSGLFTKGEEE